MAENNRAVTPEELAFLEEVDNTSEDPIWEKLRLANEVMQSGALVTWYFILGITYGEKWRRKKIKEDTLPTLKVAFEVGVQLKPIRDKVIDGLIAAAVAAILGATGIPDDDNE